MKEAIRAANRDGTKEIEAAPASIVGLGEGAVISAASAPTIIITATNRATDAYLTAPVILAQNHNTDTEIAKEMWIFQTDQPEFEAAIFVLKQELATARAREM
jgi:hypothetical protein